MELVDDRQTEAAITSATKGDAPSSLSALSVGGLMEQSNATLQRSREI